MEPNYKELSLTVAVAVYGSVASVLSRVKPPKGTVLAKELLKAAIIAGFCGIMAVLVAKYLKVGIYEQFLLGGISGYMGSRFLEMIEKRVVRSAGNDGANT